jgi:hypothetical protein
MGRNLYELFRSRFPQIDNGQYFLTSETAG